jgi:twitching motility protein PilT
MAGVDSLLRMLDQYSADELRLGTDQPPRMLQRGAPVRLSIPPTSDDMLRHLVGALLTPEHEQTLRTVGRVELRHAAELSGAQFAVTFERRGDGEPLAFDVVFRRAQRPVPSAPTSVPTAVPTATNAVAPAPAALATAATAARLSLPAALAALLDRAVALGASDVHLLAGQPPTVRVDGQLRPLPGFGAVAAEVIAECLAPDERAAVDGGRSVDAALTLDVANRFRFNVYRASDRLAAAIRVLPARAPALGELNFPAPLGELVDAAHGIVIVCGPTGSGKSATLAALATEAVRRRAGLLISLEDPIEYSIGGDGVGLVRQRQIGRDVRDFPTGLRDSLREDPDILLIGEMRDPETISLALTAAETGHLVLASLHSRSSASSIERIVDAYAPGRQQQIRVQLADALRAVIAQRLLPRLRGGGRLPALEILRGNHTVASMIRDGKTAQLASVLQSSRKEGMLPLERCLADLVRAGQISREHASAVANDATSLASYLQS